MLKALQSLKGTVDTPMLAVDLDGLTRNLALMKRQVAAFPGVKVRRVG
jgi:D-serine deaminase-like pyridoxal phosphate-dependent protein